MGELAPGKLPVQESIGRKMLVLIKLVSVIDFLQPVNTLFVHLFTAKEGFSQGANAELLRYWEKWGDPCTNFFCACTYSYD